MKNIFFLLLMLLSSWVQANSNDGLVKNTTEQSNFLYEHNKAQRVKGNPDKTWYIYFLGANKIELEHLVDHTESINNEYLFQLNKRFLLINARASASLTLVPIGLRRFRTKE